MRSKAKHHHRHLLLVLRVASPRLHPPPFLGAFPPSLPRALLPSPGRHLASHSPAASRRGCALDTAAAGWPRLRGWDAAARSDADRCPCIGCCWRAARGLVLPICSTRHGTSALFVPCHGDLASTHTFQVPHEHTLWPSALLPDPPRLLSASASVSPPANCPQRGSNVN